MEKSQFLKSIYSIISEGRERGLFLQDSESDSLRGRDVVINQKSMTSFSSCSYLGLEFHPDLIAGAVNATERYGTQFSSSRVYLSSPLYQELESLLEQIFGGHVLVTSSTSMGHLAAFSSIMTEKDAIVLDHQVHTSVHVAAKLARAEGSHVELVRHSKISESFDLIKKLSKKYETVWFACDGVYSMYGDLAPIGLLQEMLDLAPNVRLYVDDAHGMSWAGKHGKGSFLSRMPFSERMVVATSLNKAFSAGGGCLIFPHSKERDYVRMCGSPMLFSGPVQNPMLGVGIASARLHLTDELNDLQKALRERVLFVNKKVAEAGFPLMVDNDVPICYVRLGVPKVTFEVSERIRQDGYFVNIATYPGVPMKRTGVRLAITATHSYEELEGVISSLAYHAEQVLDEQGISKEDVEDVFRGILPEEAYHEKWAAPISTHDTSTFSTKTVVEKFVRGDFQENALDKTSNVISRSEFIKETMTGERDTDSSSSLSTAEDRCKPEQLQVEMFRSIHDIEQHLWDKHMGSVGSYSWNSMASWEKIFSNQELPEYNWGFYYVMIRDEAGKLLGMTCFTHVLNKDDMMSKEEVSKEVEKLRREKKDAYFLTSWCVMMGTMCSEGNHLYLDRKGPWKTVFEQILSYANRLYEETKSDQIILRDLPNSDPEMDRFLMEEGFVKAPMLDAHQIDITWRQEEDMLMGLKLPKRRYVRKYMLREAPGYQVQVFGAGNPENPTLSKQDVTQLHRLYQNVAERKLRLNVFHLPENLLHALLDNPSWECVVLTLDPAFGGPADGHPVAFYIAEKFEHHYTPFFCGLDYDYVEKQGAYRQALYRCVMRASELSMDHVHMGMDADFLKERLGSKRVSHCVYAQTRDHFNGALLNKISVDASILVNS